MKEFIDIRTQIKYTYNAKDLFFVYIRRSNGKMKLLYAGNSISIAFEKFYTLKVFLRDRKYLKMKPLGDIKEHDILGSSGVDRKPEKKIGALHRCNYKTVNLRHISNIPETLLEDFKLHIDGVYDENNCLMTINRAIPYLMAYLVSLSKDQKKEFFETYLQDIVKHKILSGGDNTNQVKKFLIKNQNEDKDDDKELL